MTKGFVQCKWLFLSTNYFIFFTCLSKILIKALLTVGLGLKFYKAFLRYTFSIWPVEFWIKGVCKEQLLPHFSVKIRSPIVVQFWVTLVNILFLLRQPLDQDEIFTQSY